MSRANSLLFFMAGMGSAEFQKKTELAGALFSNGSSLLRSKVFNTPNIRVIHRPACV